MSKLFSDGNGQDLKDGRIKTSSRLYMMWLTLCCGYKLEVRTQTPMGYSLGRLRYKTNWVLRSKEAQ